MISDLRFRTTPTAPPPAHAAAKDGTFTVRVQPFPPDHSIAQRLLCSTATRFDKSGALARKLRLNPRTLGQITGSVFVRLDDREKIDLGLNLKNARAGLCVPDFCRPTPTDDGWEYSDATAQLIALYQLRAPWLFQAMQADAEGVSDGISLQAAFPGVALGEAARQVYEVRAWLKKQPGARRPVRALCLALPRQMRARPCAQTPLRASSVQPARLAAASRADRGRRWLVCPPDRTPHSSHHPLLYPQLVKTGSVVPPEDAIRSLAAASVPAVQLKPVLLERVAPVLLLPPLKEKEEASVLAGGDFGLGDRVVHIGGSGGVPFGLRGYVVGVHKWEVGQSLEVLFESDFIGGALLFHRSFAFALRCYAYLPISAAADRWEVRVT